MREGEASQRETAAFRPWCDVLDDEIDAEQEYLDAEPEETEAPVSEGLLAATQRRDVSRFRVCRGVLKATPGTGTTARAGVPVRTSLGAALAISANGRLIGRMRRVGNVVNKGRAGADVAVVGVVRDVAANLGLAAHLEPPCSRTVTRGIL